MQEIRILYMKEEHDLVDNVRDILHEGGEIITITQLTNFRNETGISYCDWLIVFKRRGQTS